MYYLPSTWEVRTPCEECAFIRYSQDSKRYVFICEYYDSVIAELESRDTQFTEDEFPNKTGLSHNLSLYELNDENQDGAPTDQISSDPLKIGSNTPVKGGPLPMQESQNL